jgi:MerR family transcriptional regulator, heat shock protein HspR
MPENERIIMFDDDKALYSIVVVSEIVGIHPETLRVLERNDVIKPQRQGDYRKFSNNDIKKIRFSRFAAKMMGINKSAADSGI